MASERVCALHFATFSLVVTVGCGSGGSSGGPFDAGANTATCDGGAGTRRLSLSPRKELPQPITSMAWSTSLWVTTTTAVHKWNDRASKTEPFEVAGALGAPTAIAHTMEQVVFIADGPNGGRSVYRFPSDTDAPTTPIKVVDDVLNDVLATDPDEVFYAVPTGVAKKQLPSSSFPEREPELVLTTDAPPVAIAATSETLFVIVPKAGTDTGTILETSHLSKQPVREIGTTKLTKHILHGLTFLWLDGERLMEARRDGATPPSVIAEIAGGTRPFRIDDATIGVLAGPRVVRFAGECREEIALDGPATAVTSTGTLGIYVSVGAKLLRSN